MAWNVAAFADKAIKPVAIFAFICAGLTMGGLIFRSIASW